jgi:tRNA A-37 threonylcarbamoyl transferase component Bud32
MPVDAIRRALSFRPRRGSWCVMHPDHRGWLDANGLTSPRDFLALPGVVVSGHVGRNVSRVEIGSATAYLKREHRVRVRDRFRSWRDGFGWASMAEREAAVIRRLEREGLPGPKWLAFGEADGEAFLLLNAADRAIELRALRVVEPELAERLGRILARLHDAGIDQPDLFAKHVLVRPGTGGITILDWQRATVRRHVSWHRRTRGLAALAASTPDKVFSPEAWDQLLSAYRQAAVASGSRCPSLAHLRRAVARSAAALRQRAGIRRQLAASALQELVRIDGETVCAIPTVAEALRDPAAVAAMYARENDGWPILFANGTLGELRVREYRLPFGRWWAAVRGRAWRSPELKAARRLFHLERHGILVPRLLAYGQTGGRAFVLSEPLPAGRPDAEDRDMIHDLMVRLHTVGCRLRGLGPTGEPFGVRDGVAVVTHPGFLRLDRRLSPQHARHDLARLDAFFKGRR